MRIAISAVMENAFSRIASYVFLIRMQSTVSSIFSMQI